MKPDLTGKYVIARCKDAGVHAGVLEWYEGREATLKNSRRLWYWKAAEKKYLSGVAMYGLHKSSKLGTTLPLLHLTEVCELIVASNAAEISIREHPDD